MTIPSGHARWHPQWTWTWTWTPRWRTSRGADRVGDEQQVRYDNDGLGGGGH